ncbi:exodeoxyribonuclease V subunit gamma [Neptuniibacter sp. CAU 1671]|uniref:exodeoxyribonuclease V subunit gamma n=1 Tax=Neptuniibacter sp. CAU 1671 TaxID=3032593 RepID=UPI0023D99E63|nr:exodeoxyribonuclease V subunit gamma [Neptuniibacter sp. CAU 1671]MDF2181998.1 exodeoxyribonuclease V subunit gamma [Neptuniibacter sp. CAU 1671]
MLTVYYSNDLIVLKALLLKQISLQPLEDPFVAEQILVQSPGMAQWLKLELAQSQGIAASIEFPLPASFLWQCFSSVLDDVPQRSAFNKEAMQWKLMQVLPPLLKLEAFSALKRYLRDDPDQFRLYQLSQKIADLFDQYLVYRADWIADWEQGGCLAAIDQPWQPILWRALVDYTHSLGQSHWHRANMFDAFKQALTQPGVTRRLPQRLFVFGISALPQNYIEALQQLGQRIDVHLMVCNPCRYYWGDVVDQKQIARLNRRWFDKPGMVAEQLLDLGNPLLSSMGKLGRDYIYQLQALQSQELDAFVDPGRTTLLNAVQQDILDLSDPSALPDQLTHSGHKQFIQSDDRSLSVHSCHSALREVEVLHNQLLALFEENPGLQPRDIIVMMPDVGVYAPYIDAVFSSASAERKIPYAVSDQNTAQENPLLLSFARLLKLPQSRFSVSDLLELLEVPAIQRRFELDEAAFNTLSDWVNGANIRWGLDGAQRAAWSIPVFEENSWRFGLRRMLSGYALGNTGLWQGIAPYPEIEGLQAELLGKLAAFINCLDHLRTALTGDKTLADWVQVINQLLDNCYLPDTDDELALKTIRDLLQHLQQQLSDANWQGPLSATVVVDYLLAGLEESRSSQRFLVGAVNFCTLMPMRSIPFRVVCLLGMNDAAYPRAIAPMGFDLMHEQPRRGDRSRRDDDRYLFLEALLSAQEKLYISYIGRSVYDNREKIPSVLVSELLDYLRLGYCLEADCELDYATSGQALLQHLCVQHPMMPFSLDNFSRTDPRVFSYATEWLAAAQGGGATVAAGIQVLPQEPLTELDLSDLLSQIKNPCKGFFNRRLKTFFRPLDAAQIDEEPFDLDGLETYLLKQRYLQALLTGTDPDRLDQLLLAEGGLPVSSHGLTLLAKVRKDMTELQVKLELLMQGEPMRQSVDLPLCDTRLLGALDQIYAGQMVRFRPAQTNGNDRLITWIEHLVLQLSGGGRSFFRGLNTWVSFAPVAREDALVYLQQWCEFYQRSLCSPLAFNARAAFKYFETLQKGEEAARYALTELYQGNANSYGLSEDPYLARVFPDADAYFDALLPDLALMEPMFSYMEDGKDE